MKASVLLLAAAVGTAAAAAQGPRPVNPRVSLKVDDVTAAQAAARLGEAAGIPVRVPDHRQGADEANGRLVEKSRFDWTGTTFARALRQLCERYRLQPQRFADHYRLQHGDPGAPPLNPIATFERNGLRLAVSRATLSEARSVSLVPARAEAHSGSLSLQLHGALAEGDGRAVAGIRNLAALDDQGTALLSTGSPGVAAPDNRQPYPDTWSQSLSLDPPHPKAKKLAWLEGDVMVSPRAEFHRMEMPLPLEGEIARAQAGGQVVIASGYRVVPQTEVALLNLPGQGGIRRLPLTQPSRYGPTMRLLVYTRPGLRFVQPDGVSVTSGPQVIGVSGRRYTGRPDDRAASATKEWWITAGTWTFPMDEPPVKLVWEWGEWAAPERLASFRLTDIPLPPPAKVLPRPPVPPAPALSPGPERSYREHGGGILVSLVQLPDGAVRTGTLVLGLARKRGEGWDAIRWLDVPVERDGTARLEDVQPGTYQIRRLYQSGVDGQPAAPGPGRWLNEAVVVTVIAGKELALPPLQWLPAGGP